MRSEPQSHWRKQIQISMSATVAKMLEELAEFHADEAQQRKGWYRYRPKPNKSGVVCTLLKAEHKRMRAIKAEQAEAEATAQRSVPATRKGRKRTARGS